MPRADLVVVDLDGTLVLGNSFHEFLLTGWRHGTPHFRREVLRALITRAASRRGDKRWRMKQRVMDAFVEMDAAARSDLVERMITRLEGMVSAPVLREVNDARDAGIPVVLATAAPAFYAVPFAQRMGFADCLATESSASELLGERKADGVRRWLDKADRAMPERITVVTDHPDDLPLLRLATRVVLQGSSEDVQSISALLGETPIVHLDSVSEQPAGGHWLWFDDRLSGPHDIWELRTILSKHRYALGYTGAGHWARVQPGRPLTHLVVREECPPPPGMRQRLSALLRRRLVRDRLKIFH